VRFPFIFRRFLFILIFHAIFQIFLVKIFVLITCVPPEDGYDPAYEHNQGTCGKHIQSTPCFKNASTKAT
jgi:hypothetical protein